MSTTGQMESIVAKFGGYFSLLDCRFELFLCGDFDLFTRVTNLLGQLGVELWHDVDIERQRDIFPCCFLAADR